MSKKLSPKKLVGATTIVAMVLLFSLFSATVARASAFMGSGSSNNSNSDSSNLDSSGFSSSGSGDAMDSGDSESVPVSSYDEAAIKIAHTGTSNMGIPQAGASYDAQYLKTYKAVETQMQQEIINNAKKGNNGGPIFEANPALDAATNIASTSEPMIQDLSSDKSPDCSYFKNDMANTLSYNYGVPVATDTNDNSAPTTKVNGFDAIDYYDNPAPNSDPLKNTATGTSNCIAEQVVGTDNLNDFVSGNFSDGGGWATWNLVTQDENSNPLEAFLSQKASIDQRIQENQAITDEELAWGNGYNSQLDANGNIVTPGNLTASQVNNAFGSDLRQLENEQGFNSNASTLADDITTKIINDQNGLEADNSSYLAENGLGTSGSGSTGDTSNTGGGNSNTGGGNSNTGGTDPCNGGPSGIITFGPGGISASSPCGGGTITVNLTSGGSAKNATQNVATQGTQSESSVLTTHSASIAVNTINLRDPAMGGLSMTQSGSNPWWQDDLNSSEPIDHIVITPRIDDGYGDDLTGFYVIVSTKPITGNAIPTSGNGVWRSALIKPANPRQDITTVAVPSGTWGQYIRIQKTDTSRLEIAGVQIFAKSTPVIILTSGDQPTKVFLHGTYHEPGYQATDGVDGTIPQKNIIVTGKIDTNTVGTNFLTYTVTNSEGVTISKQREVDVIAQ